LVAEFAAGNISRRMAALNYVVSKGWVPIKGPSFRKWVHKYEHGTLEKDARFRNHTKKRPAMKVAKNKTVDEGYNDFSDEDEEELDEDIFSTSTSTKESQRY
jgi:hypothetical protein